MERERPPQTLHLHGLCTWLNSPRLLHRNSFFPRFTLPLHPIHPIGSFYFPTSLPLFQQLCQFDFLSFYLHATPRSPRTDCTPIRFLASSTSRSPCLPPSSLPSKLPWTLRPPMALLASNRPWSPSPRWASAVARRPAVRSAAVSAPARRAAARGSAGDDAATRC